MKNSILSRKVTIGGTSLSWLLFVSSCILPFAEVDVWESGPKDTRLETKVIRGFEAGLLGWAPAIATASNLLVGEPPNAKPKATDKLSVFAWAAVPLFFLGAILLSFRRSTATIVCGLLGTGLMLWYLSMPPWTGTFLSRAGKHQIPLIGSYLFTGNLVLLAAMGTKSRLARSQRPSRTDVVAEINHGE